MDRTLSPTATTAIPAIDAARWADLAERARSARAPLVIRQPFATQAAAWTPRRFSDLWPDRRVTVTVDLPAHGVPYRDTSDHQRGMTVAEFVTLLESGHRCYLNQTAIATFPELAGDMNLEFLRLSTIFAVNVWVGGRTRSGLHYDRADNLFAQISGRKRALLIAPRYSRRVYPFSDNPSKSQVDPETPDLAAHPGFARCPVWRADLEAGDALYIPRGWWHFIAADDVSISVNCWHADSLSEIERARMFLAGGPRVLWRATRDFVHYGVLGRPYENRMFSPPPPGLEAYRALRARFR